MPETIGQRPYHWAADHRGNPRCCRDVPYGCGATPVVERFGVMSIFPLAALLTLISVGLLARARH